MAEKENQQYKWRQRKKRNTLIGIWIVLVIIVTAGITFFYEGTRDGDPLNVAKKYVEKNAGVTEYQVEAGARSLNNENQFVQEYVFTYTADGKENTATVNMVQEKEKKYGLFEQWGIASQSAGETMDLQVIAPAGSQVLVNGIAPDSSMVKEDSSISPGAVCYELTGIPAEDSKLQVNGLPFDSYEVTIDPSSSVLDVRDQLVVGENAQTQMSELGKQMINELFTAVVQDKGADSLGTLFDGAANKENLYKVIHNNLYKNDTLQVNSLTFKEFKPVFGEVYYPGKEEDGYIGIEMKLSYTCEYEAAQEEESETETEGQEEGTETEETETEKSSDSSRQSSVKEATFYFKYVNGNCTATTIEVPNAI